MERAKNLSDARAHIVDTIGYRHITLNAAVPDLLHRYWPDVSLPWCSGTADSETLILALSDVIRLNQDNRLLVAALRGERSIDPHNRPLEPWLVWYKEPGQYHDSWECKSEFPNLLWGPQNLHKLDEDWQSAFLDNILAEHRRRDEMATRLQIIPEKHPQK